MRRAFIAPPDDQRCAWDITLRSDKSGARCMRRATVGNLCAQHAKMAANFCANRGGSDELPPDHRMDCERPGASATGEQA